MPEDAEDARKMAEALHEEVLQQDNRTGDTPPRLLTTRQIQRSKHQGLYWAKELAERGEESASTRLVRLKREREERAAARARHEWQRHNPTPEDLEFREKMKRLIKAGWHPRCGCWLGPR